MKLIRTIVLYIWAMLVIVFARPYLAWINHLKKKDELAALNKLNGLVSGFARSIVALSGAKLTVTGLEHVPAEGPVVFIGNHQSNFDIVVAVAAIPRAKGFLAKAEISKVPFFDPWVRGIGSVYIQRGEGRKALEAVIQGAKIIKSGYALMVFPEGTRSADGSLGEFKAGSLKMAVKGGAAVVPVAISGTRDVMPKGSKLFYPKPIQLTVLPAIPAETVKAMDTAELTAQVREAIGEHI